jgi:hypothetical protein
MSVDAIVKAGADSVLKDLVQGERGTNSGHFK